jgi:hypothetical protein
MGPSPERRRFDPRLRFRPWSKSVSVALSAQVRAMDPDVMITIVFCLEVFLFALVPGVVIVRRAPEAKQAADERGTEPREPEEIAPPRPPATANELTAADASELMGSRARRARPGVRS